ncbi:MAG: leucine--tRNA ligase [Candidatus Zambryskibacteria bacterium RIFCSPHIGHO2_01_FULL_46_30]|uniref:Leucine--tRNA ligase n=1 Tax=Candidatus Zambryskibacteria bacterium RIFCSPHIGHO2_01_FULL_46_30 TaxID=1802739 RepID=A0A1G2T0X5_9BACT|nr:MAG: leucine--tRNA ligase [Candidatus Zambryskibacteria bacterium RIFCSPHIGHO2_01_FULL_46_30]OHB05252.1 MAG: leucine--tRNA ligase [Candidatus Zambryskibacteria bacterium RIFCSPLOWO2_01_FULL_47_33]
MHEYNPQNIEKKWQEEWDKSGIYHAEDHSKKPKYYALIEFPYPSGDGLHVGHVRSYTAMDIVSRKRRMEGANILYPIGWDAFGLPTENYAIKTGRPPREITKENSDTFRKQLKSLGLSFDWSREINTTDPKYYKWTQWIFLKFLENGLAYKAKIPINWCPKCKIGLANEEVVDSNCERCGTPVEQKEKEQWMLAITKYADRLYDDLDTVDYPDRVKTQQKNWIGRSNGVLIRFDDIEVFTTRPDTIFGATFVVISGKEDKFTGRFVTNPATKEKIPVWEAEYVMSSYGTGAIMAVPADDERDMEFAKKFNLPIVENYTPAGFEDYGKKITKYKLRDWVFSRQRYWGEPIPVVHCDKCGVVPVPEKDLPVKLPEVEKYEPGPDGESPLVNMTEWVNTKCPKCGGKAKRETDVMPNWAGSSWYFLAYLFNKEGFASSASIENWKLQIENLRHFMPVDWYNGGMEHTVLHLLYSRFWNKFLFDLKLVPTSEPYKKRTSHGLILAEGGEKMSKSKGNVINPDTIVEQFGADTLRLYEMFMGPFEQAIAWSEGSLIGPRRFLEKVWRLRGRTSDTNSRGSTSENLMHQTIKKVSEDIESMGFNTAVSALMIYANTLDKQEKVSQQEFETLLLLLAPFAPHITEELWRTLGHKDSIHTGDWPTYDQKKIEKDEVTLAVQVDGKVRANLFVARGQDEEEIKAIVLTLPEVKKWLDGKEPKRVIIVPDRIVSIVT